MKKSLITIVMIGTSALSVFESGVYAGTVLNNRDK